MEKVFIHKQTNKTTSPSSWNKKEIGFVSALRVHISEDTKVILDGLGGFIVEPRGETYIKVRGVLQMYQREQQTVCCFTGEGKPNNLLACRRR